MRLLMRLLFLLAFASMVQAFNYCMTTYPPHEVVVTCTDLTFENISISILSNDNRGNCRRTLIATNSSIEVLPLDLTLKPLIDFTNAVLSGVHMKRIEEHAFSYTPNLTELDLSNNSIEFVTTGIFNDMTKLNILDLSRNSISSIEFNSFSNIKTLNLSSNHLSSLESTWLSAKIEVVDFSNNSFSTFDLTQMPDTLKVLNLQNNKVNKFSQSKNGTYISRLTTLDLTNNSISNLELLPLKNLRNLDQLYLQKNNISSLPTGYLSDLIHLRYLDVSYNNLSIIQSNQFDALSQLEILILSHNMLTTLEDHFRYLYNLAKLYIEDNRMIKLDLTILIEPSRKLKYVSLDNNMFSCDYLSGLIKMVVNSDVEVASGKHHSTTNINGNACYTDPSGGHTFYESNRLPIVLGVLAGVMVVVTIPWCVKYYRRKKARRVLEEIEIVEL